MQLYTKPYFASVSVTLLHFASPHSYVIEDLVSVFCATGIFGHSAKSMELGNLLGSSYQLIFIISNSSHMYHFSEVRDRDLHLLPNEIDSTFTRHMTARILEPLVHRFVASLP